MLHQARDARTEANAAEELSGGLVSPSAAVLSSPAVSVASLSSAPLVSANRLAARPLSGVSALVCHMLVDVCGPKGI